MTLRLNFFSLFPQAFFVSCCLLPPPPFSRRGPPFFPILPVIFFLLENNNEKINNLRPLQYRSRATPPLPFVNYPPGNSRQGFGRRHFFPPPASLSLFFLSSPVTRNIFFPHLRVSFFSEDLSTGMPPHHLRRIRFAALFANGAFSVTSCKSIFFCFFSCAAFFAELALFLSYQRLGGSANSYLYGGHF